MEKHRLLSDVEFDRQFATCELDPSLFSHEAHLRLAWINIKRYGINEAEDRIQTHLERFVHFVGDQDKYNVTLTIAATRMIHHFMQKSQSDRFTDFIQEFPMLKRNFKGLVESHYSFDIFNSVAAKKGFIEPDLQPFS